LIPRLDLGPIRDALGILPSVLKELRAIRETAAQLGEEVRLMRQAVERVEAQTGAVRTAVDPLDRRLDEVAGAVGRLEPRLIEVSDAIHPLRRATGLLTRRGPREGNGTAAERREAAADDPLQAP
jgi:hypothetical protein